MDLRLEKGRELAKSVKLREKGGVWLVPSQTGHGKGYVVSPTDTGFSCTCPDYENRHRNCKHILAVSIVITQEASRTEETHADGSTTVTTTVKTVKTQRVTYKQNWPKYNAAQTNEKATFLRLLHDLCAGIREPSRRTRCDRRSVR